MDVKCALERSYVIFFLMVVLIYALGSAQYVETTAQKLGSSLAIGHRRLHETTERSEQATHRS